MKFARKIQVEDTVLRLEAESLLQKCGAIQRCERHDYLFSNSDFNAFEEACQLASTLIETGGIALPKDITLKEFTNLIKETYTKIPGGCPACLKEQK